MKESNKWLIVELIIWIAGAISSIYAIRYLQFIETVFIIDVWVVCVASINYYAGLIRGSEIYQGFKAGQSDIIKTITANGGYDALLEQAKQEERQKVLEEIEKKLIGEGILISVLIWKRIREKLKSTEAA